jgi:hypothetical protein
MNECRTKLHRLQNDLKRLKDEHHICHLAERSQAERIHELEAENRALRERVRELEFREVDYIEERDALLCTKYALERQRELLARNIADVGWCLGCQIAACPNVGSHLDPLLVNREECKEMIIQWSEKAAKEAGE